MRKGTDDDRWSEEGVQIHRADDQSRAARDVEREKGQKTVNVDEVEGRSRAPVELVANHLRLSGCDAVQFEGRGRGAGGQWESRRDQSY